MRTGAVKNYKNTHTSALSDKFMSIITENLHPGSAWHRVKSSVVLVLFTYYYSMYSGLIIKPCHVLDIFKSAYL